MLHREHAKGDNAYTLEYEDWSDIDDEDSLFVEPDECEESFETLREMFAFIKSNKLAGRLKIILIRYSPYAWSSWERQTDWEIDAEKVRSVHDLYMPSDTRRALDDCYASLKKREAA
jgi:hypothetical protein